MTTERERQVPATLVWAAGVTWRVLLIAIAVYLLTGPVNLSDAQLEHWTARAESEPRDNRSQIISGALYFRHGRPA